MTRSLAALLLFAAPALADEAGWKAGFGTAKITPTRPMWMSGYASRTAPADGTETDLWAKVELPIDPTPYTVEQVKYPSKDGVEVTMFLVHRKDLKSTISQLLRHMSGKPAASGWSSP